MLKKKKEKKKEVHITLNSSDLSYHSNIIAEEVLESLQWVERAWSALRRHPCYSASQDRDSPEYKTKHGR